MSESEKSNVQEKGTSQKMTIVSGVSDTNAPLFGTGSEGASREEPGRVFVRQPNAAAVKSAKYPGSSHAYVPVQKRDKEVIASNGHKGGVVQLVVPPRYPNAPPPRTTHTNPYSADVHYDSHNSHLPPIAPKKQATPNVTARATEAGQAGKTVPQSQVPQKAVVKPQKEPLSRPEHPTNVTTHAKSATAVPQKAPTPQLPTPIAEPAMKEGKKKDPKAQLPVPAADPSKTEKKAKGEHPANATDPKYPYPGYPYAYPHYPGYPHYPYPPPYMYGYPSMHPHYPPSPTDEGSAAAAAAAASTTTQPEETGQGDTKKNRSDPVPAITKPTDTSSTGRSDRSSNLGSSTVVAHARQYANHEHARHAATRKEPPMASVAKSIPSSKSKSITEHAAAPPPSQQQQVRKQPMLSAPPKDPPEQARPVAAAGTKRILSPTEANNPVYSSKRAKKLSPLSKSNSAAPAAVRASTKTAPVNPQKTEAPGPVKTEDIQRSLPFDASAVMQVYGRKVNVDEFPLNGPMYPVLRSWVFDDPFRTVPKAESNIDFFLSTKARKSHRGKAAKGSTTSDSSAESFSQEFEAASKAEDGDTMDILEAEGSNVSKGKIQGDDQLRTEKTAPEMADLRKELVMRAKTVRRQKSKGIYEKLRKGKESLLQKGIHIQP